MRSETPLRWRTARVWLLLGAGLVLLRAGIAELRQESPVMQAQRLLILERGIDPAALFYTELPLALAAEKEVRRRLAAAREDLP